MEQIFFLFPLFVIRNVEKKRLRRALKVEETAILMLNFTVSILVNTKKQRMQRNKYSAVFFICKSEKIANAGYLEKKIADFCESYNLY